MTLYIALLRGINVGGHRVKMERLRELFGELGFSNVRTYIQSGNVFFETCETDTAVITARIEAHLLNNLGYEVRTFLRTPAQLEQSLALEPFKGVEVTANTRLMIVFTAAPLTPIVPLPIVSAKNDMKIIAITSGEIFLITRLINGKWAIWFRSSKWPLALTSLTRPAFTTPPSRFFGQPKTLTQL